MFHPEAIVHLLLAWIGAPFLLGVINRVKAWFAGRRGQPLFQVYYDIFKLLRKGAVYSKTTTWVFRAGPVVGLAAAFMALTLLPFAGRPALFAFSCDFLLLGGLLAIMRFFTVIAAFDTGSSFEGMGASREVQFSALAEPALLIALGALAGRVKDLSLSVMLSEISIEFWRNSGVIFGLVMIVLIVVFLAENSRIPVDDPNTHLELTMIHEVMVLDHSGPDFAMITYGAALKMWILGALVVGAAPAIHTGYALLDYGIFGLGMLVLAGGVGVVESTMARLRLLYIPGLLAGAGALSVIALLLVLR